ncbi:MAG: hypothetical protein V4568_19160 [Pseudomonadota bacterium]
MARLTPLSKGLIGLAVIGAVASAVWHLGLKDRFNGAVAPPPPSSTGTAVTAPSTRSPTATATLPAVSDATTAGGHPISPAEAGEMGRKLLDSENYAQARVYLEKAVQGGDGAAACHLGEMTLKGQGGIPADQSKAASLFQLAQSKNIICFAGGK